MDQADTSMREVWLQLAVSFLLGHMNTSGVSSACGLSSTFVRVSSGTSTQGREGRKRTVIGQCLQSSDPGEKPHIVIATNIADSIEILGALLHELLHAVIGNKHGHLAPFSQAARKVGLEGPPTMTVVGETLRPLLQSYIDRVGPCPFVEVPPKSRTGGRPNPLGPGSRLRLYHCSCNPPVKVRVAGDFFQGQCLKCNEIFKAQRPRGSKPSSPLA